MDGLWVLLLLIFIALLPVLLVYIWFRAGKYPVGIRWFLLSLLGGAAALFLAAFIQDFFPRIDAVSLWALLFRLFIQIALTEESSRFAALFLLFALGRRFGKPVDTLTCAAATGLLTGLGFAVLETASYGAADMGIALLRAFTAAPLHGACGTRVGMAAIAVRQEPFRGIMRLLSAVAIHGVYNFLLISPKTPVFLPILIAFTSLAASLRTIHAARNAE
jgi:RsiW-degrading membrane proteinase PrsW (M82 family)